MPTKTDVPDANATNARYLDLALVALAASDGRIDVIDI